jgi:hypothetical protein
MSRRGRARRVKLAVGSPEPPAIIPSSIKQIVNEALRRGLGPSSTPRPRQRLRIKPHKTELVGIGSARGFGWNKNEIRYSEVERAVSNVVSPTL